MQNKNIFILCLITFFLGIYIGYKVTYQPIIIPVVEYKEKVIKDTITILQKSIDTLYLNKKELIIKEKTIIKQNQDENKVIISTSDSNIIKLFTSISNKLNSQTRIK